MTASRFPLRDVQAAYWVGRTASLRLGNVAAYCYCEFVADGLDVDRLNVAWQQLIRRHDALRLIVRSDGTQQVLADVSKFLVGVNDFRGAGGAEADRVLTGVRERLSHQRLPLDHWPLFVCEVTLLPDGGARLHAGFDLMICDAASLRIVFNELGRLYADPNTPLPALASTFREYVLAEQQMRTTGDYDRARQYWLDRIEDLPPAPPLPARVDVDSIDAPKFARVSRELDRGTWSAVKKHATRARVTPTAALLAVYGDVVARYGGESHFTLNLPIFNRLPIVDGVEGLVGDFTSLLPVVIDSSPGTTLLERTRQVQTQLWQGLDHRAASDDVLRERARSGNGPREGLLPFVFTSVLGVDKSEARPVGWPVESWPAVMVGQTPQVTLDCVLEESDGCLRIGLLYVDGLFHRETIDGIVDSLTTRLADLKNDAAWGSTPITALPLDASRLERLRTTEIRPDVRLEGLFLERARATPDAPAIVTAARSLTYEEIERRSASLAARILEAPSQGEQPRIAIVIPKGWEQVAAVLAILRAGAAYVPLDAAQPPDRLRALLVASGAKTVLTHSVVDPIIDWPPHVRRLVVDAVPPEPRDEHPSTPGGTSDDLAYVIYTSGSTGTPKGVMISHRAAVNTVLEINRMCDVHPSDRVLAVSALTFDLSVYDIFGSLAAGATIVMPDAGEELNPYHWLALIDSARVTVWNSVPALLQLLLDYRTGNESLPLRVAMLSGDWIPVALPGALHAVSPDCRVLAMGGATEASIWSVYKWVDRVEPHWESVPYGRALPQQSIYVLDAHLQPAPVWTPGELYIGGAGVALGYLGDPERTAAQFLDHPETGELLYRTGDFGRYLPDGEVEFLGRRDSQVKIFGHRIELGEIENTLARHPAVRRCVVVPVGERRRLTALLACVVLSEGAHEGPDDLQAFAASHLPAYMVPRDVIVLEALPLTRNGKVDRETLARYATIDVTPTAYVEPRNAIEAAVAAQWADVLQLERVGIHNDVFDLGGDSLTATLVVAHINEAFGCAKSLKSVLDQRTVAEFCADIEGLAVNAPNAAARPMP